MIMVMARIMNRSHLASVDLNLLVVLDALLHEGSATRAARRLARTQSAISHSLAKLRDTFGDPLFVRVGATLKPTPRAEALRAPLADVLHGAVGLLTEEQSFDPARLERVFNVGTSDLLENSAFPILLAKLEQAAPKVSVHTRMTAVDIERALQLRDVDVAYATRLFSEAGLVTEPLFEDKLELVIRRGHPALRRAIDLDTYCSFGHIFVAPRGQPGGPVDDALAQRGRQRRIVMRTASFTASLRVVAATDLVVALPSRYARQAPKSLVTRPLPLPELRHVFRLAWSAALDADPAHRWFRGVLRASILEAWREVPAPIA